MQTFNEKKNNVSRLSSWVRRYNVSPIKGAVIILILNILTTIPVALAFGVWLPNSKTTGLSTQPDAWFNDYLVAPIIVGYFIWARTAISTLLDRLMNDGVLQSNSIALETLTSHQRSTKNIWAQLIAILMGLGYITWFISLSFNAPYYPSWVFANPVTAIIRAPFLFIVIYALVIFIFDLIAGIVALNKVFKRQEAKVEPLHPDGAGGLAPMGKFSANLGYAIGSFGLALSVNIFQHLLNNKSILNDYILLTSIILYICLSPFIFFLPLWTGHSSMVAYRNRLLKETSIEFDKIFTQLHTQRNENSDKNEPLIKKINQLTEAQNLIKQFPIWPFDIQSIRKYLSLVYSPILFSIVSTVIDFIIK